MTIASPFPMPNEAESPEPRSSEPSMEDILASIRRIISDDHAGQPKPAPVAAPPMPEPRPVAAPPAPAWDSDRVAPFPRGASADLLELARQPATSARANPAVVRAPPPPTEAAPPPEVAPQARAAWERPVAAPPVAIPPAPVPPAPVLVRSRFAETPLGREPEVVVAPVPVPPAPISSTPPPAPSRTEVSSAPTRAEGQGRDALLAPPLGASVLSAFETLAASVVLRNEAMLAQTMREMLRPMLKAWLDDHLPTMVERMVRAEIERVARGP